MKEKFIENDILVWLNLNPNIFAFKINTGGFFDQKRGFYRKNLSHFVIPGTPDIFCIVQIEKIPICIFFEVKSKTGRQSDNQKAFEAKAQSVGAKYFVVRSVLEAKGYLEKALLEYKSLLTNSKNALTH